MRRKWAEQELVEHWTLSATELAWTKNRTDRGRLGFYAILKFFQIEGRFPKEHKEVPSVAVEYLAKQLDVSVNTFLEYDWQGRSEERDRGQIRSHLGFRKFSLEDFRNLDGWLRQDILFKDQELKHLEEAAREWCQKNRIEPPTPLRMERLMRSVVHRWESEFFTATFNKLPTETRRAIDALIDSSPEDTKAELSDGQHPEMMFSVLRRDPGRAGLKSVLAEIAKRRLIDHLALPHDLFVAVPSKVLEKYRRRAAAEPPRELRMHPDPIRYSLIAAFCWQRRQEITDGLVELLMQVIHRIVSGAADS